MQFPLTDFQMAMLPWVRQQVTGNTNWCRPSYVFASIRIESGWNPTIASSDGLGSIGLMQVLPSTVQQMIDEGYIDQSQQDQAVPQNSIAAGVAYLVWIRRFLMNAWGFHDTILMHPIIEAYNEGVGNVLKGIRDQRYWYKWSAAQAGYAFIDDR